MSFTTGAALLDAVVLAVVSREGEGTYGYKITQEIKQALELSESTLYPVLRRLQRDGCLTIYDEPFNGRNRRYYKITPLGRQQLAGYKAEWKVYAANIDHIFGIPTTRLVRRFARPSRNWAAPRMWRKRYGRVPGHSSARRCRITACQNRAADAEKARCGLCWLSLQF